MFTSADVISSYTRADAISDEVLVDISASEPDVCQNHYGTVQIDFTRSLWGMVEQAVAHPRYANDVPGVVHDILWMARPTIRALMQRPVGDSGHFRVIITGTGRRRIHQLKVATNIAEGEHPCLTFMLAHES